MPDYNLGCIYKIKHNEDYDDANIYIGSTCNFTRRKFGHKTACNNEKDPRYNTPLYQYIRENGGWDYFIMIKLHDFQCENKYDLNVEERRMIDMLKPNLNKHKPTRTQKEYNQDNREKRAEHMKEYYEANREKIAEYNKEYREDNRGKIIEKRKEYYEAKREKIAEKRAEKVKCDICGCESTRQHLKRHQQSNKCKSFQP
jgi:hypothetical protein